MEIKDISKIYKASALVSLVTEKLKTGEKGKLFLKNIFMDLKYNFLIVLK